MLKSDKPFGKRVKGQRKVNFAFLVIDIKVGLIENVIFFKELKEIRALASVVCGKERNRQSEQPLHRHNCGHMSGTFKEQPGVAAVTGYSGEREGQINKEQGQEGGPVLMEPSGAL